MSRSRERSHRKQSGDKEFRKGRQSFRKYFQQRSGRTSESSTPPEEELNFSQPEDSSLIIEYMWRPGHVKRDYYYCYYLLIPNSVIIKFFNVSLPNWLVIVNNLI